MHPVIHLDMGRIRSRSKEELASGLLLLVQQCAEDHDCSLSAGNCYDAFTELIRNLTADGGMVVILVDEYDKALLAHIGQESARSVQEVLKSFYAIIKNTEKTSVSCSSPGSASFQRSRSSRT